MTLQALTTRLSSYKIDAHNSVAPIVPGDDKAHHMQALHGLIASKDFLILNFSGLLELLARRYAATGHPKLLFTLLDTMAYRGAAAGIVAHSSDQAVLPNFVMFDYDKMPPNMQLVVTVHETAHILTPPDSYADSPEQLQRMEAIAYATEYLVCAELGIDALEHAVNGLAHYGISPEVVSECEPLIQKATQEISRWIANYKSSGTSGN